ncbi:MAG: site-2 protease family protein [Mycobacteriales bacterium]
MYALGVLLFAVAIAGSIMLHEAGHMVSAKRFGMKVTQYFLGFGPTLWSFRRGETEYGVKAIPAGGFVKIIGMTPLEDEGDTNEPRAFWRAPVWKRTIVLSAGSITHFALGFVLLYVCALFAGLPVNPSNEPARIEAVAPCVVVSYETTSSGGLRNCRPTDPAGPANVAGLHPGDQIVAVGGRSTPTQSEMLKAIRSSPAGPTPVTYIRDGKRDTVNVSLVSVSRPPLDPNSSASKREQVSAIGVLLALPPPTRTYGPVDSLGQSANFTGQFFKGTFTAIAAFPEKIPMLVEALRPGSQRDPNGPISVVGASRLGGEALATKTPGGATTFLLILAGLNFFIGVFNLFPLLPLDGGHIAVIWYERVRSWIAARFGRPDPGRVDYTKLLPVTYVVIVIFGGISLLTIAADIVNPVRLFQ